MCGRFSQFMTREVKNPPKRVLIYILCHALMNQQES